MNPLDRIKAKKAQAAPVAPAPAGPGNPLDRIARQQRQTAAAQPATALAAMAPVGEAGHTLDHYQAFIQTVAAQLANIHDLDAKQAHKRKVLPEVLPFVEEYVASGDRYPNSVAVEAMIWLFDVGDIERALTLALYLIDQACHAMPKRFGCNLQTFVCGRGVYDWAAEQLKANQPAAPYLEQTIAHMELEQWELFPAVASGLYALAAKHAERLGEYGQAVTWCNKAEAVNPEKAGVKTLKARCLKAAELEKAA
jgi:hypothetical protein